ncbi:MAG: hypothetical protein K0R00_2457 [Herbinix sp.]|nr:hypothetical protein [Herbinix sp.]
MRLYLKFFMMNLKAAMQYKVSFLLTLLGNFLVSFNVFLGVLFMFYRFDEVKGYQFHEVILCFATVLMSYTIAEVFMRGFDMFASTIGNGEFDRILLRPRSSMLQIVMGKMEFTRIGRVLQSLVMFLYGIHKSEIEWNFERILTLILMVLGGAVIFGCLFIIYAGFCFFTLEGLEFMNILTDGAREYGKYPLDVYGKAIFRFCTFVIPYTLFQYYPFLYLTGRVDHKIYMLYPILGCWFLIPSYLFWRLGIRHYKSTGS